MKIAVPTAATAGTRIAMQPITIAMIPIVINAFQLRASPARSSGSIDAPPNSMRQAYAAPRTGSPIEICVSVPIRGKRRSRSRGATLDARSGVV